ncbi:MAG: cellulase family glycosylhydrolase [Lachnospiraceae bacterium]|nr:cellulase family glycosylhydrolase [Lachnospiraceae bacterium]
MTRKIKRIVAFLCSFAMLLTMGNFQQLGVRVSAAENEYQPLTVNESQYDVESILSSNSLFSDAADRTTDGYDGYIQSLDSADALSSKYFKITYKITDTSSLTDDSKLFVFQPYTSAWGGWNNNFIYFKDAIKGEDDSYTSYIKVRDIKDSLSDEDYATLAGININFVTASPQIELTDIYTITVASEKTAADLYNSLAEASTGQSISVVPISDMISALEAEGKTSAFTSNFTTTKYYYRAYAQVTRAHTYSQLGVGAYVNNGASNAELLGSGLGLKSQGASVQGQVHNGYGTEYVGQGIGAAGSGIYEFNIKDTGKWNNTSVTAETAGFRIYTKTKDTEAKLLGFVLYTDSGRTKAVENGAFTVNHDEEGNYTGVSVGFDIPTVIESKNPDSTDTKPKSEAEYKYEAEEEIYDSIRSCNLLTVSDCVSEESYNSLKTATETAKEFLENIDDCTYDEIIEFYNNYMATIRVATAQSIVGLANAINYCKSLKEEDYQTSFDDLNAAIKVAEPILEVASSKTDAELKAARDALEAERVKLVPKTSTAESSPKNFRILSKSEVIDEMAAGINLGNTMDGGLINPTETSWQAYKTTKEYIKALHDAGYNTVRIPVTWNGYINDDYSINEAWISRVQEIVDYCVDQDMYAIINIHHDGAANHDNRGDNTPTCWLDTYEWNIEKVYQKYAGVWKTIAERFKDYDEHLIFESMNEVTDAHGTATNEDTNVLNALNQLFVNTVRATGSNNLKRWLAITGRFATYSTGTTKPEDVLGDKEADTTRLMFAVHIYKSMHTANANWSTLSAYKSSLESTIKNVKNLDSNMPIYIGEYGRDHMQVGSGCNKYDRALDCEYVNALCKLNTVCPIVWDQGDSNYATTETNYGIFNYWNRPALKPVDQETIDGAMRGSYLSHEETGSAILEKIYKRYGHSSTSDSAYAEAPEVKEITSLEIEETAVSMEIDEWKTINYTTVPEATATDDVILWSTDDDSVVTVSKGKLHAKGAGITTVYAKSQSGSVEKEITVIVALTGDETATAINTDKVYYELTEEETAQINASLVPEDSTDAISYTSSNPEVASVNKNGLITANIAGSAYIIVSAASGVSNIINVVVKAKNDVDQVQVALNVMINSGEYKGDPVTITGDGSYSATLDLVELGKTDSSVPTTLEEMTAIYLKDINMLKSVVESADIRFDKVTVNDSVELTMKTPDECNAMWESNGASWRVDEEGFKSALKAGNQFDTNDPINGWDGSLVKEVTTTSNHTVNFSNISNPTKVKVDFTIRGIEYVEKQLNDNPATALDLGEGESNKIAFTSIGDTKEVTLKVTPADSKSTVTVYSTDKSVAAVNSNAISVDENGNVTFTITGVGEGTATVVAITDNGYKQLFSVGVGADVTVDSLEDPVDPTPEGLNGNEPAATEEPTEAPGDATEEPAEETTAPSEEETTAPSGEDSSTATEAPAGDGSSASGDAGATATATPAPAGSASTVGTASIDASKTLVVVTAGKSVSVGFNAVKEESASAAAGVEATSGSADIADAKVDGTNVSISVPSNAVKGSSTTVTLTSKKADGTAVTATINVYVQNSAKKYKAAKNKLTVKSGKSTKLVIKGLGKIQNAKKPIAENITVKGKILTLSNVKYAKKKIILTLTGSTKAKNKNVKIKVGSKTVKVKATVK